MDLKREHDFKGRFIKSTLRCTKEELETLYHTQKLGTPEIAKIIGVSKTAILEWMKEFGIQRRTHIEALSLSTKKLWKKPEYRMMMLPVLAECWNRSEERSQNTKSLWENPNFRRKLSEIHKEVWKKPEHRLKMTNVRKRRWQNPEYRAKMAEIRKKRWANPEYKERVIRKVRKSTVKRPTKPERTVLKLIKQHNLPFKYTGDGEIIIDGLNPDFSHADNKRKVIEVFGTVFHNPEKSFFQIPWKQQYWGKIIEYKKRNYDCLILWATESEEEMLKKMQVFAS